MPGEIILGSDSHTRIWLARCVWGACRRSEWLRSGQRGGTMAARPESHEDRVNRNMAVGVSSKFLSQTVGVGALMVESIFIEFYGPALSALSLDSRA